MNFIKIFGTRIRLKRYALNISGLTKINFQEFRKLLIMISEFAKKLIQDLVEVKLF